MPSINQFKTKKEYNAWFRSYRKRNAEKIRAYNRKYNSAWRKKNGYGSERKYAKNNPEKMLAHKLVNRILKNNKISRGKCFCGIRGQAHHFDYKYPFNVVWLCSVHHSQVHRDILKRPLKEVNLFDYVKEKLSTSKD